MMCYPPTGYIMFSLKGLGFLGGWGLRAGSGDCMWGPGGGDRITQASFLSIYLKLV